MAEATKNGAVGPIYQGVELFNVVGFMVENNKSGFVGLLRKSGIVIPEKFTDTQVLNWVYRWINTAMTTGLNEEQAYSRLFKMLDGFQIATSLNNKKVANSAMELTDFREYLHDTPYRF